MTPSEYAPILISVYTRKGHFIRLIDSLKKNKETTETKLYVASDAASQKEDVNKVIDIRNFISEIEGFKEVILLDRKQNIGSHISILTGISEVFKIHNKLIFLEDDNYVSKNFLSFMNDALNKFQDDEQIFSVSGYNYPIEIPDEYNHPIYLYPGFSAWGVGLWKEKWSEVDWKLNNNDLLSDLSENKKLIKEYLGERVYWSIKNMCQNNFTFIDAYICYHLYKQKKYSIFPTISKVRNYGHDGLGEHGGINNIFASQKIDDSDKQLIFPDKIDLDNTVNKELKNYFKLPLSSKIKKAVKKLLLN